MASIQAGREGREKFGHRTKKTEAHSTTNKEKRKTKNFKMITHKRSVVSKGKKSLRDKQVIINKKRFNFILTLLIIDSIESKY
jgi:protein SDA1